MKNKKAIIAIIAVLSIIILTLIIFLILKNNKKYTVSFDTQGGTIIESITIKANEKLVLPNNPEKEGYVFLQWVDEEDKPITNNIEVTKDMKLIAKWAETTQDVIKVSFDTDGGSEIGDVFVIKGETLKLPNNPIKEGYVFKSWVDKNETPIYQDALLMEDTVLKAIWEKEEKKEEKKEDKKEEPKEPEEVKQQETKPQEEKNIEVTNIALNKSLLELVIGNSDTLTPTIVPNNATDKTIQWTSSDSNIISVDNSGKVTAKAIGSATITAKTSNGKTATVKVTSDVKSITLVPGNLYISKYGTITSTTITAKIDANGYEIPDNLITWSAPDASGANAPAYMSISGKTATINARDVWGSTAASVPVTVKINNKQVKTTIYVEPKISVSNLSSGVTGSESNGRLMLTFKGEKSLYLQSNIEVIWDYNVNSPVIAGIEQSNNRNLKLSVQYVKQNGLNIKARSKAGQVKEIVLTPTV